MQLRHTEESVIGAGCLGFPQKMSIAKDDDRRIALPTAAEVGCRGRDTGFSVPRTDPDERISRIRLLPQVVTRRRREG
jgi:hypothetical protein